MTKHRAFKRAGLYALLPALSLLAVGRLAAQSTATPTPGSAAARAAEDETIELSPFVIEADEDEGYSARNTLAGTRLRTELKDVGSAISVVTQKFLKDTNSKSSADLLVYTTGTEVAGQGGNFTGGGDGTIINDGAYVQPVANTRVRGLAAADNLRDFFLTDIPWDSYNVGRVDLQRGPNSILFGIGSPAGIINSSLNTASFKDGYKVELQVATFGSVRGVVDLNKSILENELAVRVSALMDNTNYRQEPAFRDDQRVYAAVNYQPKFLARGSARTSIRANFEKGNIDGINPRLTPPMDAITPWFASMNRATYDWRNSNEVTDRNNARYSPYVGAAGGRIFDGQIAAFDYNNSAMLLAFAASPYSFPAGQPPEANDPSNGSYKGITTYNSIANNLRLPGYVISPYKAKSLTDSSVFNYYDNLIEGENRRNSSKFDAFNVTLNQTFMNNKVGFEVAYDQQTAEWDWKHFLAWDAAAISVDIMRTLIDGSANPNVGRPMVIGGGGSSGSGKVARDRDSVRATAFGELDFRDVFERDSALARALGKHVLTYSGALQRNDTVQTNWTNWHTGAGYAQTANSSVGQASRDVHPLVYLGPSLTGRTSVSGLNLERITSSILPTSTNIRNWDTLSRTYKTYALPILNPNDSAQFNDGNRPYVNAAKTRDEINSQVFVWQGYLLNGAVVPMVGWRKDVADSYNAGSPNKVAGLVTNFADPEWRIPNGLIENGTGKYKERIYNSVDGQTHTFSIVGHRAPPGEHDDERVLQPLGQLPARRVPQEHRRRHHPLARGQDKGLRLRHHRAQRPGRPQGEPLRDLRDERDALRRTRQRIPHRRRRGLGPGGRLPAQGRQRPVAGRRQLRHDLRRVQIRRRQDPALAARQRRQPRGRQPRPPARCRRLRPDLQPGVNQRPI
jgi:outer membrane receptor protein involved in Fe transport